MLRRNLHTFAQALANEPELHDAPEMTPQLLSGMSKAEKDDLCRHALFEANYLAFAVFQNNATLIDKIVESPGFPTYQPVRQVEAVLCLVNLCTMQGYNDVLQRLLHLDGIRDRVFDGLHSAALRRAMTARNVDAIDQLCAVHGTPNSEDRVSTGLVAWAFPPDNIFDQSEDMMRALLRNGFLGAQNLWGESLLRQAMDHFKGAGVVLTLLDSGWPLETAPHRDPPLRRAAGALNLAAAEALVARGADGTRMRSPSPDDRTGETVWHALFGAVSRGIGSDEEAARWWREFARDAQPQQQPPAAEPLELPVRDADLARLADVRRDRPDEYRDYVFRHARLFAARVLDLTRLLVQAGAGCRLYVTARTRVDVPPGTTGFQAFLRTVVFLTWRMYTLFPSPDNITLSDVLDDPQVLLRWGVLSGLQPYLAPLNDTYQILLALGPVYLGDNAIQVDGNNAIINFLAGTMPGQPSG